MPGIRGSRPLGRAVSLPEWCEHFRFLSSFRTRGFLMSSPGERPVESKRVLCGVLAIVLGSLGVHKFVLGNTTAGIIMFLLSCTTISGWIGIIEGIIYLTKSDAEFIQTYQVEKKAWF